MCRMKWLLALALGLAFTTAAQAQSPVASEKRVDKFAAAQPTKPARVTPPQHKPAAALAVALTDDADSILLPAFASRATPSPIRFLRVGVEWSF